MISVTSRKQCFKSETNLMELYNEKGPPLDACGQGKPVGTVFKTGGSMASVIADKAIDNNDNYKKLS